MADREDQDLSISSVLSGKVTYDEKFLYASKINSRKVFEDIRKLKEDATSQIDKIEELINNVNSVLASTNSKRFYSGEEAQLHLGNLNNMLTDTDEIKNYIDKINEDDISFIVSKYNIELNKIKKNVKLKFLKRIADEWNQGKHIKNSEDRSYKLNVDGANTADANIIPADGEQYHKKGFVESEIKTVAQSQYSITKRWIYYDYINYWRFFTGDDVPFNILDLKEDELEEEIKKRGISLTYDPAKIIDYEK